MAEEEKIQENQLQMAAAFSQLEKMAPKYCTTIQVSLLSNNNIVLTLIYNEPPANGVLIERVVIDIEHANSFADILKSAVEKSREQVKK